MKVGDLVRKKSGELDAGEIGVILEINTNEVGNTIVTVSAKSEIKSWYSEFIEVLDEER